jgi:hypothetical protein
MKLVLAVVLLAACGSSTPHLAPITGPQGAVRVDEDGDGVYGPWMCPAGATGCNAAALNSQPIAELDCDDHDASRHPGAVDEPGDGIDQNCDQMDGINPNPPAAAAPAAGTAGDGSPLLPLQHQSPTMQD